MTPKQSPCTLLAPNRHHLFKVNNLNTGIMGEICSKLALKTQERRFHTLLWCSIVDFEQVTAIWASKHLFKIRK